MRIWGLRFRLFNRLLLGFDVLGVGTQKFEPIVLASRFDDLHA